MPDILIRMEMPTGCASCDFAIYKADSAYHYCFWLKKVFIKPDARLKDCPLVELPAHGELIDVRELRKKAYPFPCAIGVEYAVPLRALEDAPVIVPASEEADNAE